MISEITQGIKVSVNSAYLSEYSHPEQFHHVFSYHIAIQNSNEYTVRLLRRQWFIYDSNGSYHEVEGEGVVGETPVLLPLDIHEYSSGCNLNSTMGKMTGKYLFERLDTQEQFFVNIPEFQLIAPYKLN